jgi:hypothetical protein
LDSLGPNPFDVDIGDITGVDTCYLVFETSNDILLYDFSKTPANGNL